MRKLFYIPIEEYDRRYTADWIQQFEQKFKELNLQFETIKGNSTTTKITCGDVLDAYGTTFFKLSQLKKITTKLMNNEIIDDDVILFADGWFPGVENLAYIRNISNKKFKLACILHAGSWDCYDFTFRTGMREWAKHLENSWFEIYDYIFVATEFHKQLILQHQQADKSKIYVTGIPFYPEDLKAKYLPAEKENIIIFPHRCNEEKHPELFDILAKSYPDYKFIKSIEVCTTRDEYFKLLAKSKIMVSFADQETFGYATLEAMALDNYVIVPDKLSYKETVPEQFRYKCTAKCCNELDIIAVRQKIDSYINTKSFNFNYSSTIHNYEKSIDKMIDILERG